jgi:hypothetical protein
MDIFEQAVRWKVRFPYRGMISVEDLWDLNVQSLDEIFKSLNASLKQKSEDSLLETKSTENSVLDLQISIVKYIVSVKLKDAEVRKNAEFKRVKKHKILSFLAEKEDSELKNKSSEELKKLLEEYES